MSEPIFHALVRTHHITSRKKVAKLKLAAANNNVYALLRYGGCPGIMYCQGSEHGVRHWVSTVQRLRYKDCRIERKPALKEHDITIDKESFAMGKLEEVDSVKDFGTKMQSLGIWDWWRKGMGYAGDG